MPTAWVLGISGRSTNAIFLPHVLTPVLALWPWLRREGLANQALNPLTFCSLHIKFKRPLCSREHIHRASATKHKHCGGGRAHSEYRRDQRKAPPKGGKQGRPPRLLVSCREVGVAAFEGSAQGLKLHHHHEPRYICSCTFRLTSFVCTRDVQNLPCLNISWIVNLTSAYHIRSSLKLHLNPHIRPQ